MSVFACVLFRVDISDTLMYVYEMLGAELLSNLYDKLGRLLTNTDQPTSWQVSKICTHHPHENKKGVLSNTSCESGQVIMNKNNGVC